MKYNIIYVQEPNGGYSVSVLELPGCISEGDTKQEADSNIKEAIILYLQSMKDIAKIKASKAKEIFIDSLVVDYETV